mmetsp:Transcript_10424/g.35410  ORF Transcript_10424/g.35410 Transcript_10424/m.35410 type:complete len:99 (-) Transcript_10424:975-1271(-)
MGPGQRRPFGRGHVLAGRSPRPTGHDPAFVRAHGCPWDARTCASAASRGHLQVLQWARANRCPWNEDMCHAAAQGGRLEVLHLPHSCMCIFLSYRAAE